MTLDQRIRQLESYGLTFEIKKFDKRQMIIGAAVFRLEENSLEVYYPGEEGLIGKHSEDSPIYKMLIDEIGADRLNEISESLKKNYSNLNESSFGISTLQLEEIPKQERTFFLKTRKHYIYDYNNRLIYSFVMPHEEHLRK